MKKKIFVILLICSTIILTACGFHPQGEMILAPPLTRMYLQTPDPYGYFPRMLREYLKMSHVQLVATPAEADTILVILQDSNSQRMLSVNGTQQTRQYALRVTIVLEITDATGQIIVLPQVFSDVRIMTAQSNQILGSSNEANLFYQQMRRALAVAVMNRIASREITEAITHAFCPPPTQNPPSKPSAKQRLKRKSTS